MKLCGKKADVQSKEKWARGERLILGGAQEKAGQFCIKRRATNEKCFKRLGSREKLQASVLGSDKMRDGEWEAN